MTYQRIQRDGIDNLIGAGALPSAAGLLRPLAGVPTPEHPRTGEMFTETGPCGNPGGWCSFDVFTALPGWKCKLCSSCETEWRKMVGSL